MIQIIYRFSPSIDVDMTWEPVKKYIEHEMKIKHTEKEPLFLIITMREHYKLLLLHSIKLLIL